MTESTKAYTKDAVCSLLRGYAKGLLTYLEATKAIIDRHDRGELLKPEAEYALRLLNQTRSPR